MNIQKLFISRGKRYATFILLLTISLTGCKTMNNAGKGAIIGTGAGAALGAGIGKLAGNTAIGAIIGAGVGGATGAVIGNYMDKQAAEMQKDLEGAKVERVGEGIKITFDSGILFALNSSALNQQSKDQLDKLSQILNKYSDTNILVEGHTDNTGTAEYNMKLSERRAQSVSTYLEGHNVAYSRITTKGYGEEQPIVANDTPEHRALNRRVEIAIFANEKLKKAAEKGTIPMSN
jgi:outer membrane protein OmpA-like peptidoglycan-associated protein